MQAITLSTCMNPSFNVKFLNEGRLGRNALEACYRARPASFLRAAQPGSVNGEIPAKSNGRPQPERRVSKGLNDGIGFVPQTGVFVFASGFTGAKFP